MRRRSLPPGGNPVRAKQYGESLLLLIDVAEVLDKLKIPYIVIGAAAVSVYGLPRASVDADAVIQLKEGDEKKLFKTLKNRGISFEVSRGDLDDPIRLVIKVGDKYGNRVDILSGIRGIKHDIFKRVKKIKFRKDTVKIPAAEDLIVMKAVAGSYRDIEDIRGIVRVMGGKLDRKLLEELTANYGKRVQKKISALLCGG